MNGKKIIICIVCIFVLLVIALGVFTFVNKNNVKPQEKVAADFSVAIKGEEQLEKFIEDDYDLKAISAINNMYKNGFPEDKKAIEEQFLKEYDSISEEQIKEVKEEKTKMLKELLTDKEYTLKTTEEKNISNYDNLPDCFKVYEATYESDNGSIIVLNYSTYNEKLVSIISVYTNEK